MRARFGFAGTVVVVGCVVAGVAAPVAAGLPLLSDQVDPDRLPLPYGVGLTVYAQQQEYEVDSLSFSIPGLVLDPSSLVIDNSITEVNLKLDLWLFPFMNVFAIFGDLDGSTTVDLRGANVPLPFDRLVINLDGRVLGAGMTLVYGGESWFTSLTGIYTETDLSGDLDSKASAVVVSPRVGLHGDRASFWVGAMYQAASESHQGTLGIPFFGEVDFAVDLKEKDQWNMLIGMHSRLTKHLTMVIEGGIGNRYNADLSLSYRF